MQPLLHTLNGDMFHMPLPILEKILRPVIVYLFLVVFLRLFGKRELALLSLSNTVQNAMIGDDNSVSGGILGALSLLAINWVLAWVLFRSPKVTVALEGQPSTLIRDGVVDEAELKKQTLSHEDLISILNRNGFIAEAAYGGREAIDTARRTNPELILSDVLMPHVDGVEAAITIQKFLPATRIVLFSGQAATVEILARARQRGYQFELLAKPLHPTQLIKHLRQD